MIVRNRSDAAVEAGCTLVTGGTFPIGTGGNVRHPRSATLAAGQRTELRWYTNGETTPDFGTLANFSCMLPPGVELASIGAAYRTF